MSNIKLKISTSPGLYQQSAPQSGQRSTRPARPTDTTEDALLEALASEAGFELVQSIPFKLNTRKHSAKRSVDQAARENSLLDFELDGIEDSENAVVLLEQDGRLTWVTPAEAPDLTDEKRGGRKRGKTGRRLRFSVNLATPVMPDSKRFLGGLAKKLGEKIVEKATVYVLKFAASVTVGLLSARLERNIKAGLIHMAENDIETWELVSDLKDVKVAENPRVLLFIHGTFSSTAGSYGALTEYEFLAHAREKYDLIIGYDHHTLSQDPMQNAIDIFEALEAESWFESATFDAVAYSRGGLVLRCLIESIIPDSGKEIRFKNAVFVGCTNCGTQLAEPENWKLFLDRVTNLTVNAGRVAALITGNPAPAWASKISKGLSAFVQCIMDESITREGLPGIAAMEPDGSFVTQLNREHPKQPSPDEINYYAITSNFEADLFPIGKGKGIVGHIALAAADPVVDNLLGEDNDMVVHTRSMANVGVRSHDYFKSALDYGKNGAVFHTVYFANPSTSNALRNWLDVRPDFVDEPKKIPVTRSRSAQAKDEQNVIHSFFRTTGSIDGEIPVYQWTEPEPEQKTPIKIEVEWNDIRATKADVYAVGHYKNVVPAKAEYVLDCVVSGVPTCGDYKKENGNKKGYWETFGQQLLITDLTEQGHISGDVASVDFYPWGDAKHADRQVAICGMGRTGQFDEFQGRRVIRNLARTVNRLPNRETLATVLIGGGEGMLEIEEAVRALLNGLSDALGGREQTVGANLKTVRIVEYDLARAQLIADWIRKLVEGYTEEKDGVEVHVPALQLRIHPDVPEFKATPKDGQISREHLLAFLLSCLKTGVLEEAESTELKTAVEEILKETSKFSRKITIDDLKEAVKAILSQATDSQISIAKLAQKISQTIADDSGGAELPDRIGVVFRDEVFRVSAISETATIPERLLGINPNLVHELANEMFELGRWEEESLESKGRFLSQLMIPNDFTSLLGRSKSIVFEVDRHTANLHWELLSPGEAIGVGRNQEDERPIGLTRPLSRQLRTDYSSAPRIRRATSPVKRALIIGDPGDPALEHNLPGARAEAHAVRSVLRKYGFKVTALIGAPVFGGSDEPYEVPASMIAVLEQLMSGEFDLVHYAGHGDFDPARPDKVGWLFKREPSDGKNGAFFTANELERVDNVPPLVVANACLSARTSFAPDNSRNFTPENRASLLPSLADEFMRKGVRHYIGTAWEVSDTGAITFAKVFYEHFFGRDATIGEAMLEARKALESPDYPTLWAAYQLYGMPTFRWKNR